MNKISWAFGVVAFLLLGTAAWQFRESRASAAHWQPTLATVNNCRVVKEWVDNPDRARDGQRYLLKYFAEFQLNYSFNGYQFHAWQRDSLGSNNRSSSEAVLGKFATGSQHPIWVNPEAPEEMALQVSGVEAYLFSMICATLGSIFGFLTLALRFWPSQPLGKRGLGFQLGQRLGGVTAPVDSYLRQQTEQHQGD
jgi:hypothetical protein